MTSKMPKRAFQIILGAMVLIFVVTACNNNKTEDKKEPATDTTVKMSAPMDTTKMDTAQQRPTAPGNAPN
jgi:hypothetical protein